MAKKMESLDDEMVQSLSTLRNPSTGFVYRVAVSVPEATFQQELGLEAIASNLAIMQETFNGWNIPIVVVAGKNAKKLSELVNIFGGKAFDAGDAVNGKVNYPALGTKHNAYGWDSIPIIASDSKGAIPLLNPKLQIAVEGLHDNNGIKTLVTSAFDDMVYEVKLAYMTPTVRKAVLGDVMKVKRIIDTYKFERDGEGTVKGALIGVNIDEIANSVMKGNMFVAEVEGRVIGTARLEEYEIGELRSWAVLQNYQGNGAGQRLGEAVVNLAREKGFKEIYTLTQPINGKKVKALGFRETTTPPEKLSKDCLTCQIKDACIEVPYIVDLGKNGTFAYNKGA